MSIQTTGIRFKQFYSDKSIWTEEAYHDDLLLIVNGEPYPDGACPSEVLDSDVVLIESGFVILGDGTDADFEELFKKWDKGQSTMSFVVEIDISQAEELKELIRANGGKVL